MTQAGGSPSTGFLSHPLLRIDLSGPERPLWIGVKIVPLAAQLVNRKDIVLGGAFS